MNRSLLLTLAAACVVLAGLNIYQFIDRQSLRDELSASRSESESERSKLLASKLTGSRMPSRTPPTKTSSRPGPEKPLGSPPEDVSPEGGGFQDIAAKWAEMMENPAMQKQMLAQMDGQLGPALGELYAHLELEGEDLTHFKNLLSGHWLAQQQVGMKMMSARGDPEKTAAIQEELKQARESTHEKIREFLNDEQDYAYFEAYQKQLPDRVELEQYASALQAEGLALNEQQKEELLATMAEERVATDLGDVSNPENWDFDNFSESTVTEVIGKMSDFHQRVLARAAPVLDQQQVEILTSSQEQHRTMQEMGMKMGLEMMKGMAGEE